MNESKDICDVCTKGSFVKTIKVWYQDTDKEVPIKLCDDCSSSGCTECNSKFIIAVYKRFDKSGKNYYLSCDNCYDYYDSELCMGCKKFTPGGGLCNYCRYQGD